MNCVKFIQTSRFVAIIEIAISRNEATWVFKFNWKAKNPKWLSQRLKRNNKEGLCYQKITKYDNTVEQGIQQNPLFTAIQSVRRYHKAKATLQRTDEVKNKAETHVCT